MLASMRSLPQSEDYFAAKLIAYQDAAYADRFRQASGTVRAAVAQVSRDDDRIARKAVRALYRVMLIKDEYEIARLMTSLNLPLRSKAGLARRPAWLSPCTADDGLAEKS